MQWRPNKWIAAMLILIGAQFGLGLFYAGARRALHRDDLCVATLSWPRAARSTPRVNRPWYSKSVGLAGIAVAYELLSLSLRAFLCEHWT